MKSEINKLLKREMTDLVDKSRELILWGEEKVIK